MCAPRWYNQTKLNRSICIPSMGKMIHSCPTVDAYPQQCTISFRQPFADERHTRQSVGVTRLPENWCGSTRARITGPASPLSSEECPLIAELRPLVRNIENLLAKRRRIAIAQPAKRSLGRGLERCCFRESSAAAGPLRAIVNRDPRWNPRPILR